MGEIIQVTTTIGTKAEAQEIARFLVAQRLAACVQIVGPIQSTYWWQEAITTEQEWLCVIKSRRELAAGIEAAIRDAHSYAIPEIIVTPILAGSADYLEWVSQEVRAE